MAETNMEWIQRLERENYELMHTLREIVKIEQYRCKREKQPEPKWVDEALELIQRLESK